LQGGDLILQNDKRIVNSTASTINFTDGSNSLFTIVDAGSAGNATSTGTFTADGQSTLSGAVVMESTLDVQGGSITLENDEVIDNSADATIAFTDGTNTLFSIVDAGTTGNGDFSGTLTVDGTSTLTGAAALNGGITVDSTAFTVADTSGNVATTGTLGVTGLSTLSGGTTKLVNIENLMSPTVLSVPITWTAAAGGTGTVATIADGEVWFIHNVMVNVTTDFACTGNDTTLDIGDGNDADGFLDLADAQLQKADTEGTGFTAGWQGMTSAIVGAYLDANDNSFVYAPSGGAETIDWLLDETSGETITAGAATIYVIYTRIL